MLKSLAFRSRMPLRSLVVVGMVGFLAGCGGGGGGGGSEPAPAPQKPALALSWQLTSFTTPEVTDPGQPLHPAVVRDFGGVAVSPGGSVHLAWRERTDFKPFISRSHDAGATWHGTAIDDAPSEFAFLTTLTSGRLVAGDTVGLIGDEWRNSRLWWSDDDGVTWGHQNMQRSSMTARMPSGNTRYSEYPVRMVEHNGKVLVWMYSLTVFDPVVTRPIPTLINRLYYWDAGSATLTHLPIVPPQPGPLPIRDYYSIRALAAGPNGYLYVAIGGEVLRTADGISWEALPRASSDAGITELTVLADGTLAAGLDSYANVFFFKDGSGWRQSLLPEDQINAFDPNAPMTRALSVEQILELQSGALFASTPQGVYATCDGGTSWERIAGSPVVRLDYVPVKMVQAPDGTVWAPFNEFLNASGRKEWYPGLLKIQPPAGVAARDFVKCS